MSDKIKELAEQAEMAANKGDHVDVKIMMEKFAELILKECLKYIDDSFGDIDYVKFMIKRNFGVEE